MPDWLLDPWPWWIAGPLIGLFVPALLLLGNRSLGFSANLRHICAATLAGRVEFFRYNWKQTGGWNLLFLAGTMLGGFLGARYLSHPAMESAAATKRDLALLGIHDFTGFTPKEIFSWGSLATIRGVVCIIGGGFLVGFGTAYAGGCTSGHAIAGLSNFQLPSLIAVIAFFAGGVFATHILFPLVLR